MSARTAPYHISEQIAPSNLQPTRTLNKPHTLKIVVCIAHQNWCVRLVQTGTRYMVCCAHLFMVCIAHLIWCAMHTIFGVENTLYTVCYYIAFCPGLAFTHVNMYNIDTFQLQSSHGQYSKCVVLLYNVFVQYFVADIQSDCHAAPPETYA